MWCDKMIYYITEVPARKKKEMMIKAMLDAQSCPTLCSLALCSPPGSSVHGILQARIPARVAMPYSRGSSQPRDRTRISCIPGRFFTVWAIREALMEAIVVDNFSKLMKSKQVQWIPSRLNTKKTIRTYHHGKLLKTNNKGEVFRAARKKLKDRLTSKGQQQDI